MPIRAERAALYPKNWPEISARVREHAGHKCEFCGVGNGDWGYRDDPTDDMFTYIPPKNPPLIADMLQHAARVRVATERQLAVLAEQSKLREAEARPPKPPTNAARERERRQRQLAKSQTKQKER